jgi:hypothetical protein
MRDIRHVECILAKLPLDITIVRESIHKRTKYEAPRPSRAVNAAQGLRRNREVAWVVRATGPRAPQGPLQPNRTLTPETQAESS